MIYSLQNTTLVIVCYFSQANPPIYWTLDFLVAIAVGLLDESKPYITRVALDNGSLVLDAHIVLMNKKVSYAYSYTMRKKED